MPFRAYVGSLEPVQWGDSNEPKNMLMCKEMSEIDAKDYDDDLPR